MKTIKTNHVTHEKSEDPLVIACIICISLSVSLGCVLSFISMILSCTGTFECLYLSWLHVHSVCVSFSGICALLYFYGWMLCVYRSSQVEATK